MCALLEGQHAKIMEERKACVICQKVLRQAKRVWIVPEAVRFAFVVEPANRSKYG